MTYRADLGAAGVPYLEMGTCRNEDFNPPSLQFHNLDLTGKTLEYVIATYPSNPTKLATITPTFAVETNSYDTLIAAGRYPAGAIPAGSVGTDTIETSVVTITAQKSVFASFPSAAEAGDSVRLFYSLRESAPDENMLLAGDFIFVETA